MDPLIGLFSADQLAYVLASLSADVGGYALRGLQDFKFDEEMEGEAVYGNDAIPIQDTPGTYKGSGSFKTLLGEAVALAANLGDQYLTVTTTIGCTLNQQNGGGIIPVDLYTVRLKKFAWDMGEAGGAKPGMVEINFRIMTPANLSGIAAARSQQSGSFTLAPFFGL